jgi:hypothetical protein
LALQVPAIQFRTTDVVTRIAEWASSGNVIRIQQAIRAKEDRRQWIDENLIRPCQEAGVRVDPKHIIEYAHQAEECDNLKRELDGLGAQTEALSRATDVLRALGGDLKKALPLLNTQGQGVVYGALITAAYLSGSGFGRGRTNTVRRFTTVAESNVYSQDEDNQAKSQRHRSGARPAHSGARSRVARSLCRGPATRNPALCRQERDFP